MKLSSTPIFLLLLSLIAFTFASCNQPEPSDDPITPVDAEADGIYILNEGLYQMNNSTLSYYDFQNNTLTEDIFLDNNQRGLGDTGNDLAVYGSKLYCVVNNSNRVEIMRFSDAVSLQAVQLDGKQPRKITFYKGKAYVSCFDGDIVRIDTATMAVDGTVYSGSNPEGLCVCNGKLYVANSGALNYPNYGNTVSVIDLNSFTLLKTITTDENPCLVQGYNDRYVYVASRGNYGDIPYNFQKIDAQTDEIILDYQIEVLGFTLYDHYAYLYTYNYSTTEYWIKVLDLDSDTIINDNFISDGTTLSTPYSITVNPLNQDIYITDAGNFTVNGDVYCFSKEGKKKFSFETGLNPNSIVFRQ